MARRSQATSSDPPIVAPLCSIFRRFLKKRGLKFTAERAAILDAVLGQESVFEVEQLVGDLKESNQRVSRSTVYRTIKHLVEAGIIQEVLLDSRQSRYQLVYGREHRDHLVCIESDEVIEFASDDLVRLRNRICREHGLDPVGHRMIIFGVKRGQSS